MAFVQFIGRIKLTVGTLFVYVQDEIISQNKQSARKTLYPRPVLFPFPGKRVDGCIEMLS